MQTFFNLIDPVLILPFRLFDNPMTGWWVGNFCLALWCVVIGELTMAVAHRVNRKSIATNLEETEYYHEQSMKAKAAGDEKAYTGINKLANQAYGKSFFLLMAMGMAGLWPAFFAAGWLDKRFGNLQFNLPAWAGGFEISFLAPFILIYILQRIAWSRIKKKIMNRRQPPLADG